MRSNNLGNQIKDVVQDAMDSMDFHNLNSKIQRSVSNAINDVRKAVGPYKEKEGFGPNPGPFPGSENAYRDSSYRRKEFRQDRYYSRPNEVPPTMNKPIGKVSGIVMIVLSSIGMALFGIASLVLFLMAEFVNTYFVFGPIIAVLMSLFTVCLCFLVKGITIKSRTKRFLIYQERLQGNNYFKIDDVAQYIGKPSKWVVKDLMRMIRLGMFPQGHIDSKQTCFIGDNVTYEQYRMAELSYEERRKQEEEQRKKEANASEEEKAAMKAKELGETYITQVREANDIIEGKVMSDKLDRLELIIKKIFEHVSTHPAQLPEIRKFMDYYLPITIKLVNVYKDFEHQQIQSTNIVNSRKEIEDSLDTINEAFEKLFDGLYEDVAMEVATDINVLNTLLAQEGLTKKDFQMK